MMRSLITIVITFLLFLGIIQVGWTATEFSDGFDAGLANWETGKHPKIRKDKPVEIAVKEGQVVFPQNYEYLQTSTEIAGDFEFSFDVIKTGASPQAANLWVQLTGAPELGGVFRFAYGADKRESINLGLPPQENVNPGGWDGIDDGGYLRDNHNVAAPHQGRITFTYQSGKVRMAYTNEAGETIATPFVQTSVCNVTKIRIWGSKNTAIDNVKLIITETQPHAAPQVLTPTTAPEVDAPLPDVPVSTDGYVQIGDKKFELDTGVITTQNAGGDYLTAIILYPDTMPQGYSVNINMMHSDPSCAGKYKNTRKVTEGGFSGTVIFYRADGSGPSATWVFADGDLEIVRKNSDYIIKLNCEGVNAVGAGVAGPEFADITVQYTGGLFEEK